MDKDRLVKVAGVIAARNVPATVREVVLSWLEGTKQLELYFFSDQELSEDELDLCEIALTELYADVWQGVEKVATEHSVGRSAGTLQPHSWVVYARPNPALQPTAAGCG